MFENLSKKKQRICYVCRQIVTQKDKITVLCQYGRNAPVRHSKCIRRACQESVEMTKALSDYLKEYWGK